MDANMLDQLYKLSQIAEADLRLLEIESSCACMCNATYNDRKRAIIEEYHYQKGKIMNEINEKYKKGDLR